MFLSSFRHKPTQILLCCFFYLIFSNDWSMADKTISVDMFRIKRNKNRNLVQYSIYLDRKSCQPQNTSPAYVFWRDLEIGPDVTDKIKWYEKPAYGISNQSLKEGELHLRLNALPNKLITVNFRKSGDSCKVTAYTTINGERAIFEEVYVYAKEGLFWPTVKWIETRGYTLEGQFIKERIKKD